MAYLNVEGARICYEVIGESGPWVTLINGHTRGKSDFKLLARKLANKPRRVLIFDNRGSGETESKIPFEFNDFFQDVLDLWQNLKVSQTSIIGISMGGFIAQSLADKVNNIEKLILVSTALRKSVVSRSVPWGDDFSLVQSRLAQNFSRSFAEKNQRLIGAMVKGVLAQIKDGQFIKNAQAQDIATNGFDISLSRMGKQIPTLILHGDEDQVISVESAKEMGAYYQQSVIKIFPHCGHLILAEKPGELFSEIDSFLE